MRSAADMRYVLCELSHHGCPDMPAENQNEGSMLDPEVVVVLLKLWTASEESPGKRWSLAKLGKQAGLPMSTLRRHLVVLEDAGIVQTDLREDGTGNAWLTPTGSGLCQTLFVE
jgi:DNA-binding transcriptional ArsR family regulator